MKLDVTQNEVIELVELLGFGQLSPDEQYVKMFAYADTSAEALYAALAQRCPPQYREELLKRLTMDPQASDITSFVRAYIYPPGSRND